VDGDMCRPRLHKVFQLDNSSGLSDVLAGNAAPAIQETHVPNLFVLPGGQGGDTATELMFQPRLAELFTRLRGDFDMVLVDAPPVLLQMPAARLLSRLGDAVILVVRAASSGRAEVRLAQQRLTEDGSYVMGTVLNNWNPGHSTYRYRGYYKEAV
jgi:polysaccharide biosynthesis transport protein